MPILAAEPSVFPDDLLDSVPAADDDRQWWAVYTKSRQEKSLSRQLHALQVPYYLPLVSKVSLIGGRKVRSQLPLFGSYVFMFASDEERIQALATERVSQLFFVPDKEKITRDLRRIQALIASGAPLTVEARLTAGRRVRVKSGSLMGLEGTILARRGEDRLVVAVEFLQQGVSVLISDFQVEPI